MYPGTDHCPAGGQHSWQRQDDGSAKCTKCGTTS